MQESKFNQQVLPAFRPKPTFMNTILTFAAVGIVLVAVGIHIQVQSGKIQEFIVQYDTVCELGDKGCKTEPFIDLKEVLEGPLYIYYELDNFY